MRIWLACFLVLFALAELFDWIKDFSLPLPIYILGGAFLAVASNYTKLVNTYNPLPTDISSNISREIVNEIDSQAVQIKIESSTQTPTPITFATNHSEKELQPADSNE